MITKRKQSAWIFIRIAIKINILKYFMQNSAFLYVNQRIKRRFMQLLFNTD